jgi:hypothetical protein
VTLWQVGPANDGKYEGQNVGLVHQGNEVKVNWLNIEASITDGLQCKAR